MSAFRAVVALLAASAGSEAEPECLAVVRRHREVVQVSYAYRRLPDGAWHRVHGANDRMALCGDIEPRGGDVQVEEDPTVDDHHVTCAVCAHHWARMMGGAQ